VAVIEDKGVGRAAACHSGRAPTGDQEVRAGAADDGVRPVASVIDRRRVAIGQGGEVRPCHEGRSEGSRLKVKVSAAVPPCPSEMFKLKVSWASPWLGRAPVPA